MKNPVSNINYLKETSIMLSRLIGIESLYCLLNKRMNSKTFSRGMYMYVFFEKNKPSD